MQRKGDQSINHQDPKRILEYSTEMWNSDRYAFGCKVSRQVK